MFTYNAISLQKKKGQRGNNNQSATTGGIDLGFVASTEIIALHMRLGFGDGDILDYCCGTAGN
jgi:hypothetical protein